LRKDHRMPSSTKAMTRVITPYQNGANGRSLPWWTASAPCRNTCVMGSAYRAAYSCLMHPELSVIIPMYDEEQVLPLLVDRLRPVLDDLDVPYEVVAVDDGSRDQTPVLLQRYRRQWPQLR